jgi:hypothetical protein
MLKCSNAESLQRGSTSLQAAVSKEEEQRLLLEAEDRKRLLTEKGTDSQRFGTARSSLDDQPVGRPASSRRVSRMMRR